MAKAKEPTRQSKEQPPEPQDPPGWPALIWRLIKEKPVLFAILLAACAVCVAIYYVDILRPKSASAPAVAADSVNELPIYTILSLMIDVSFEDSDISKSDNLRTLEVRSIYTIRLNRDLDEPTEAFQKKYVKSGATSLRHWTGTTSEVHLDSSANHYTSSVRLKGKKGDIQTLMFGAELEMPFPLSKDRAIRDIITMRENEEWWGYPNHHKTQIDLLTIAVSSKTTLIQFEAQRLLVLVKADGTLSTSIPESSRSPAKPGKECLWGRWKNVLPDETVAIRFTW